MTYARPKGGDDPIGTDIHLEAEAKLTDGTWERIPHGPKPCWSCSEFDQKTGEYSEPTGKKNVLVREENLQEGDVVLSRRNGWATLDRAEDCQRCQGTGLIYPQWLHDRNYNVFSILGNVRNGYGFAGVPTSSGFRYISDCRGLPDDLSAEVLERLATFGESVVDGQIVHRPRGPSSDDFYDDLYEKLDQTKEGYWSLGDHSFSWVLLSEVLEDFNWDQTVQTIGVVGPYQFEQYRKHGHPETWSGGVSGRDVEHVSNVEMAKLLDEGDILFEAVSDDIAGDVFFGGGLPYTTKAQRAEAAETGAELTKVERKSYFTRCAWKTPYREAVGKSFFVELGELAKYAPDGDLKRVRLVFGFDS